ncbi:hypothetical protein PanWU01x14_032940, partial [Parasponia andersonii]
MLNGIQNNMELAFAHSAMMDVLWRQSFDFLNMNLANVIWALEDVYILVEK